jgi:hypothetical protein
MIFLKKFFSKTACFLRVPEGRVRDGVVFFSAERYAHAFSDWHRKFRCGQVQHEVKCGGYQRAVCATV